MEDTKSEKLLTTNQANNFVETLFVKLGGMKDDNHFYKQITLNDNKNDFDENFNDNNYKITVKKLHDDGWKTVISLLPMFLCLVMDAVFQCIHNSIINI